MNKRQAITILNAIVEVIRSDGTFEEADAKDLEEISEWLENG